MTDDARQVDDIFCAALDIASPVERQCYIDTACGNDPALRARVQSLLASYDRAEGFLDAPAPGLEGLSQRIAGQRSFDLAPGSTVDGYRIIRQLGEGGIGTVFLAEQDEPVRRSVALKVIKLGMDTQQVIERFGAERQALALMHHPNIAAVYDAGSTALGRPYFVMELVEGAAITTYCDTNRLNVRQRLELFAQVCQAIQHAHQKGLIHRDIKPGNVLVSTVDQRAVAKVIDFGIAKATDSHSREKTQFTQANQLIGTIEYMSPEQAEGSLDIDTRTDVYSLGVMLYELLTGATPLEGRDLRSKAYGEMQRIIREIEPEKPSTRLSALATLPEVAAHRGVEPRQLDSAIRGELDWIVMKCLEKDRAQRYESASALAADVFRFLSDEPVSAAAPSARYRLQKFIRRHRGPVIAATVVLLSLVAGMIGTTWGMIGERQARQRATEAAAAEKVAKETAEARESESRAVLDFVQNKILAAARPLGQEGGLGHDVSLRKAVEAALPFVESSFKDQPAVETRLRLTMGLSFWYLGDSKTAAEQMEAALALSTQHKGPDHADTLACMSNLASQYALLGRFAEATALREKTLQLQSAKLDRDHRATLVSMNNLANSYNDQGREAEALVLRERALELMRSALGPEDGLTISGMNNLALTYQELGRQVDALKLREEALAMMRRKYGTEYPGAIPLMNGLGISYEELGRDEEALKIREETLALAKAKLGPQHPMTLWAMNNLAVSYAGSDRDNEALALREQVLERRTSLIGSEHPDTLDAMHNLASSFAALGRHDDALKLREQVVSIRTKQLGEDHPDTMRSMKNLAATYAALGRHADALALREKTLELRRSKLGADHPDTLRSMFDVAKSQIELGRITEATSILDECIEREARVGVSPDFHGELLELRKTLPATTAPATTRPIKP